MSWTGTLYLCNECESHYTIIESGSDRTWHYGECPRCRKKRSIRKVLVEWPDDTVAQAQNNMPCSTCASNAKVLEAASAASEIWKTIKDDLRDLLPARFVVGMDILARKIMEDG